MAYTTIDDPGIFFNTVLYTGNGSASQAITGVGFQPDWNWIKARNAGNAHVLQDVVRGISGSKYKFIQTQTVTAEGTSSDNDGVSSLDSDGFTVGYSNSGGWNENAITYAAWNWKAGGTASSNTDGSITSTVSANTTAGFSIVKYTSNGTAGATVGHGLGVAPDMVWTLNLTGTDSYGVGTNALPSWDYYLHLSRTLAQDNSQNVWNDTAPSSSVVTLGNNGRSNTPNNHDYIMYCFHNVKGYSKIGKYTGNGASGTAGHLDGPFVYCGFKPAWLLVKRLSGVAQSWHMWDNKRNGFNNNNFNLLLDEADAEDDGNFRVDFLSNGFKWRVNDTVVNGSGIEYLFMAFAESPIVNSKGVSNNAR